MNLLKKPITIPLIKKSVSLGLLLFLGALFFISFFVTLQQTNQNIFCRSCHEMTTRFDTWKASSHKDVDCIKCHISPGMWSMIVHKAASIKELYSHIKGINPEEIKGHVPDVNCTVCHKETRELVVYHSLKITHRKHWERGISCVTCHASVVHGPRAALKNTPRMATCFTCHDGKKAPNNCSLCHVTLRERKKEAFSPDWVEAHRLEVKQSGRENCARCHHDDFCNTCHKSVSPHGWGWIEKGHVAEANSNPAKCDNCHDRKFCKECHDVKRSHRSGWLSSHMGESKKNPLECVRCHKQSFCQDCHAKLAQHPAGWDTRHMVDGKQDRARCAKCHEQKYCDACHTKALPKSHEGAWLDTHKHAAAAGGNCTTCHTKDFCASCHQSRKPASHGAEWMKGHRGEALKSKTSCLNCHDQGKDCTMCHTMTMPHPSGWRAGHGTQMESNPGLCVRCHDQTYCVTCHRSSRPGSHGGSWRGAHGKAALSAERNCYYCHTKASCTSCHGTEMPHPSDWTGKHSSTAKAGSALCQRCHETSECMKCHEKWAPASHMKEWRRKHGKESLKPANTCQVCHRRKQCDDCHGLTMPHPAKWQKGHVAVVAAESDMKGQVLPPSSQPKKCASCHKAPDYCRACHTKSKTRPTSHREDWMTTHMKHAAAGVNGCLQCHKKDDCAACHGTSKPSSHNDEWQMAHAATFNASVKAGDTCAVCHREDSCAACHDSPYKKK